MTTIAITAIGDKNTAFSEKIIRDNSYFLVFINQGVSNFGDENDRQLLEKANLHDFKARLFFAANNNGKTFIHIRKSQKILKDLYFTILKKYYLLDTAKILRKSFPVILLTKDTRGEKFLQLGFRSLQEARHYKRFGMNVNVALYSMKIRHYIDAIKLCREGKRYAFLALIESKTPIEEKADFKKQTIEEALNKPPKDEIDEYHRIKNTMRNMIERRLIIDSFKIAIHHDDNFGYIIGKDILKDLNKNLSLSFADLDKIEKDLEKR